MNKVRRKQLDKINEMQERAKEALEDVLYNEQDCFDNMPENLQCSLKAQDMETAIDNMEDAVDSIEDAIDCITEAQMQ